jgi:hypothetical protein
MRSVFNIVRVAVDAASWAKSMPQGDFFPLQKQPEIFQLDYFLILAIRSISCETIKASSSLSNI